VPHREARGGEGRDRRSTAAHYAVTSTMAAVPRSSSTPLYPAQLKSDPAEPLTTVQVSLLPTPPTPIPRASLRSHSRRRCLDHALRAQDEPPPVTEGGVQGLNNPGEREKKVAQETAEIAPELEPIDDGECAPAPSVGRIAFFGTLGV
jgi:hypothetical protein